MTTYRVDYATADQPDTPVVTYTASRANALNKAAKISARPGVGTAYAIATVDGQDTGQRVYSHGAFDRQDDQF
jgi:hypothetical protein